MSQLITETADQYGCFRTEAKGLIKEFNRIIMYHLQNGESVDLSPLGVVYTALAKRPAANGQYRTIIKLKPSPVSKKLLTRDPD